MFAARLIIKRPFITLTMLYCAVLIVLNYRGFFISPPRGDVARLISASFTEVAGRVSGIAGDNGSKQVFTLKVTSAGGSPCRGTLLVHYFVKGDRVEQGDLVSFGCVLARPPDAKNPGAFDYAAYLRRTGIYAVTYISSLEKTGREAQPFYLRLAQAAHADMVDTIQKALPPAESSVLIPMLIGDKQTLPDEEKRAFTGAGVMHTLVVSGFNVAYVAGIFILLFRVVGFKRRHASLLTMPFLILYLMVTGYSPPALRATVMAFSIILSMSLNRDSLIYQSLALAAAVILIFDPQALFNASFQLSFAATIGIVYLYPFLMEPFGNFPRWFRDTVCATTAVSLAAQLAVMPILACYFNRISPAGLISNIPIVPLTGIVTGAGILLYLVHFISSGLTWLIAYFSSLLMKAILALVHYFAGLPYATIHVGTPDPRAMAVYYFFLWGVAQARRVRYMPLILASGGAFLAAGLCVHHLAAKDRLEITSLYAGSGTAVHVSFPGNIHWLIDCGRERDGKRVLCPYFWSRGIRKIDKVVVTSEDRRHSGGLKDVTDNFQAEDVVYPRSVAREERYFIGGSTVTLVPVNGKRASSLNVLIDFAGKRAVFTRPDPAAESSCYAADVVHISCRGKQAGILAHPGSPGPGAIILSGSVPKDMENTLGVHPLNKCGAVSVLMASDGISIKDFREGKTPRDGEEERD